MIEAGWVRSSINGHVGRIRRMFKWASENELLPAEVWKSLESVSGLKKGRSEAVETEPVEPVPEAYVEDVEPFVSRQVWAMIELQRLSGMRPGEVTIIRGRDLDTSGSVWLYVPASHKTEHHKRGREIYLGPQAQEILRPFLKTDLQAWLFSPRDAVEERRAEKRRKRKTKVQPSQQDRRKAKPRWQPGARYTTNTYRQAIIRGIEKANRQRREAGEPELPHWHPNQLRHNAATRARREDGLETAQLILGHSKADVTEVYAERDRHRAMAFIARHG